MTAIAESRIEGKLPEAENLEPDKCGGWSWRTFEEMRNMHESQDVQLFQPLVNLMAQRRAICATLTSPPADHGYPGHLS